MCTYRRGGVFRDTTGGLFSSYEVMTSTGPRGLCRRPAWDGMRRLYVILSIASSEDVEVEWKLMLQEHQ